MKHTILLGFASLVIFLTAMFSISAAPVAYAGTVCGGTVVSAGGPSYDPIHTTIDFGCVGKGNPIMDILFAIVRFLTTGVGIVVVGSVVLGGIQYITSQGDPQKTAAAVGRIRGSVIALLIFIFAYAILNYVIPSQLLTK